MQFTSNFGPAAKWKDSTVAGIAQVLEGVEFQTHDVEEIMSLLSILDEESLLVNPNPALQTFTDTNFIFKAV